MPAGRSREDFVRFLDYLGEKGLIPSGTAASRRATANKVTAILSEEEAADITTIDLDAVMQRFHNLNSNQYTPESLQTYRSRMKTALDDFRSYTANPLSFKPGGQPRSRLRSNDKLPSAKRETAPEAKVHTSQPALPSAGILPIALRADVIVQIAGLPFDLSKAEAQKISNIVLAHAVGE